MTRIREEEEESLSSSVMSCIPVSVSNHWSSGENAGDDAVTAASSTALSVYHQLPVDMSSPQFFEFTETQQVIQVIICE